MFSVAVKYACAAVLCVEGGISLFRLYKLCSPLKMVEEKCSKCGKPRLEFSKVLFFPDKQIPCYRYLLTSQGCRKKTCAYSHDEASSFIQLIRFVLRARKSIDLCMFSLTCNELATAILIKHRLGATVRVISDTEYMNLNGSKVQAFLKEGIAVRHDRSSYLMHHKFLVVDKNIVLTGSFNWTHAAVIGNNENVLVTNNQDVVVPYLQEFDRLWEKFALRRPELDAVVKGDTKVPPKKEKTIY